MALSIRELHGLIGRVDNDNRKGFFRAPLPQPARAPSVRPDNLELEYQNLVTRLEPETGMLWAWMKHPQRACFTPELMADGRHFQEWLREEFSGLSREEMPFRYLVWASKASGAWSMGGDLSTFVRLIKDQDEAALRSYAYRSIDVLYDNYCSLDLPILTVALVEGDAVGGGFEAMLTHDLVIAERTARFGLPEILFNLFPGMGAFSFLKRRVGERTARMLVEDGKTRTAEELHELGLIDIVCDPAQAKETLRKHVADRAGRFNTDLILKRVRMRSDPLPKSELVDIVDLWIELALDLNPADLRRMECLARHQERRRAAS